MQLHLCLYSNDKYKIPRKILRKWALVSGCFDQVHEYDKEWLESTDLYKENESILADPSSRGDGWWLWKPYIIRQTLDKMEEGDVLFYLDSSDTFFGDFRNFLLNHFKSHDFLLTRAGENQNSWYTKRDTFVYMGCDSPEYWGAIQLEAGVLGIKKNSTTTRFIEEWMEYCKDYRIVTNCPNESGKEDLPGYIAHRNDQSILTNLKVKYKEVDNSEVMKYVLCNLWDFVIDKDYSSFNERIGNVSSYTGGHSSFIFRAWYVNYALPLINSIQK